MLDGTQFKLGWESVLMAKWKGWIKMCINMLDGDGNFRFLPTSGGYFEQDWKWMEILNAIRSAYIPIMQKKAGLK